MSDRMLSVLFVCLGNICRSPLAEAAFRQEVEKAGLEVEVDSAGTSDWHVGKPPDARACKVAEEYGLDISHLRGRQLSADDFHRYTHIFALDHENLHNIRLLAPDDASAEVCLLLDVVPGREGEAVADPYFGEEEGFAQTWADVTMAARALVERLRSRA